MLFLSSGLLSGECRYCRSESVDTLHRTLSILSARHCRYCLLDIVDTLWRIVWAGCGRLLVLYGLFIPIRARSDSFGRYPVLSVLRL